MQVTDQALRAIGLRERKKIRTREAIRREAFRLIEENGYASTTVEQIAEAADVSPSTFFRYFPSKESVLLADDLDQPLLEALAAQPVDLSPIAAFRRALEETYAAMSEEQMRFENTRQRLIFSIPELKVAFEDEYRRAITTVSEAVSRRLGRARDDFEVRVFAGALAGAVMALSDQPPIEPDTVYRVLDFLEAGMPLS
jgi:AcrR family transcriptional regulator